MYYAFKYILYYWLCIQINVIYSKPNSMNGLFTQ